MNTLQPLYVVCTDVAAALKQVFGYLVRSALVRNGDPHLKYFAVLYRGQRTWLSWGYDQVTTTIYTYGRAGEPSRARSYRTMVSLQSFGRDVCSK